MTAPRRTHRALSTTARRTAPLPLGWHKIRAQVLRRDGHQCVLVDTMGRRCPITEHLEVDHIGDEDDHGLDNLRTLCHAHHAMRTSRQANEAKRAKRAQRHAQPRHPGLM